ncbi:hypothetical protein T09_10175 [Trichinella sp. T9]|nr:hypothetical protein T09_10175 [Trichinella sp. T9]
MQAGPNWDEVLSARDCSFWPQRITEGSNLKFLVRQSLTLCLCSSPSAA